MHPSGHAIAQSMFEQTKSIKAISFKMKKYERINGQLVEQKSAIKIERNPLKVYSYQLHPKEGLEVLYVEGANSGNALINPNGFPWVNLSLDPQGSTMRKDQHHTIRDAGHDLFVSILEHLFEKYGERSIAMIKNKGIKKWDGHDCWLLEINNPHFNFEEYTVQPSETLISIADRLKVSEYMILENNKNIKDYRDVSAGQKIKIPNDYSPKITLMIDKVRMIPLVLEIYDQKGLYEKYEYTEVKINPNFSKNEFTPEFEAYGF